MAETQFVSILLPVYNASKYLEACLDSLLKQSHPKLEIIAIDDHSKDSSFAILRQYKKQDKRIRIYRNKKRYGLAITLNRAVRRAKGQFVAFTNASSISSKARIKKQLQFLLKNKPVVAVGTQHAAIRKKDKDSTGVLPTIHDSIYNGLLAGKTIVFESVMINRMRIPKDLLYFTKNKYPIVYADLFMKLPMYGLLANINERLYFHQRQYRDYFENLKIYPSLIRLWLKSMAVYDYRPPLRILLSTLFKPLVNPIKSFLF